MIEVDRKAFLASVGVGALELMDPEEKAEALEHYMLDQIDEAAQQQVPGPRGAGNLLRASEFPLEPMPWISSTYDSQPSHIAFRVPPMRLEVGILSGQLWLACYTMVCRG